MLQNLGFLRLKQVKSIAESFRFSKNGSALREWCCVTVIETQSPGARAAYVMPRIYIKGTHEWTYKYPSSLQTGSPKPVRSAGHVLAG